MPEIVSPDIVKDIIIKENDAITTPTKKVLLYGWDLNNLQKVRLKVNSNGEVYTKAFPSGSSLGGSVDLTNANTWYSVPSTTPTKDYVLVVSIETANGTIRWSYDNGGTPGTGNGNLMPEHLALKLGAGKTIYCGSSVAGDKVNFTIIEKE